MCRQCRAEPVVEGHERLRLLTITCSARYYHMCNGLPFIQVVSGVYTSTDSQEVYRHYNRYPTS